MNKLSFFYELGYSMTNNNILMQKMAAAKWREKLMEDKLSPEAINKLREKGVILPYEEDLKRSYLKNTEKYIKQLKNKNYTPWMMTPEDLLKNPKLQEELEKYFGENLKNIALGTGLRRKDRFLINLLPKFVFRKPGQKLGRAITEAIKQYGPFGSFSTIDPTGKKTIVLHPSLESLKDPKYPKYIVPLFTIHEQTEGLQRIKDLEKGYKPEKLFHSHHSPVVIDIEKKYLDYLKKIYGKEIEKDIASAPSSLHDFFWRTRHTEQYPSLPGALKEYRKNLQEAIKNKKVFNFLDFISDHPRATLGAAVAALAGPPVAYKVYSKVKERNEKKRNIFNRLFG